MSDDNKKKASGHFRNVGYILGSRDVTSERIDSDRPVAIQNSAEEMAETERLEAVKIYLDNASLAMSNKNRERAQRFLDLALARLNDSEVQLLKHCWSWYQIIVFGPSKD